MKLWNASEQVSKRSEGISQKDSPGRPGEEPDEPSGETAVPDGVHSTQEGPRGVTSDVGSGTNAPSRDRPPGGHLGDREESRGVEGVRDRDKVVDRAEYDWIRPRCEEDERGGDANPPSRDRGPGGQLGEQVESGANEGGRERQNDGDGGQTDEGRGGKDGATSGARRNPKRVETTPLAGGKPGQHGRRKRGTADIPEASTPPTIDPRRPTDHPNPPRCRGRLKRRSTRVSTSGGPTRSHGRAKAALGGSDASYMMYMDRRWW